jgi:hypothetical protein
MKLKVEGFTVQLGESVAAAGGTEANRELVADESRATTGEDPRAAVKHARYSGLFLAEGHLTRRFAAMLGRIALLPVRDR